MQIFVTLSGYLLRGHVVKQEFGPINVCKKSPLLQLKHYVIPNVEQVLQVELQERHSFVEESGKNPIEQVPAQIEGPGGDCKYVLALQLVQTELAAALLASQLASHPKHSCAVESG